MKIIGCPFCSFEFKENCEYIDVGVGFYQVTPNVCPECNAEEIGHRKMKEIGCSEKDGWFGNPIIGEMLKSEYVDRCFFSKEDGFSIYLKNPILIQLKEELYKKIKDIYYSNFQSWQYDTWQYANVKIRFFISPIFDQTKKIYDMTSIKNIDIDDHNIELCYLNEEKNALEVILKNDGKNYDEQSRIRIKIKELNFPNNPDLCFKTKKELLLDK